VLFFVTNTLALQMDVFPGEMRCIGQEMDQEDVALFVLSATHLKKNSKEVQSLMATITDPEGDPLLDNVKLIIGARPTENRKNIEVRGVYEMCFELIGGTIPVRVFFHVDFKSRDAEGEGAAALENFRKVGKNDLPSLETHLKSAEVSMAEIIKEIEFAKEQEILLKAANDMTTSRIQWFGILSIAILFLTSLWQLVYLRSFFASKKLL